MENKNLIFKKEWHHQLFLLQMKMKNLIKNWNWQLFFLRMRMWTWKNDKRMNHLRNQYCRLGCHKLRNNMVSYSVSGQRTKNFRYLECVLCKYKFFTTKKQKDDYLAYQKEFNIPFHNFFKAKGDASTTTSSTSSES